MKLRRKEIDTRVRETAELLRITHTLDRKPASLSGGEQQRLAIGRAIIPARGSSSSTSRSPIWMRSSATTCGPSSSACTGSSAPPRSTRLPDQLEALSIGERVAVIQHGRITQVDTPERLYARPVDRHVAALIGDPPINLVKGTLKPGGNAGPTIELPFMELDGNQWREGLQALDAGTELLVGIRPHDLALVDDGTDGRGGDDRDHRAAGRHHDSRPQGGRRCPAHGGGGSDGCPLCSRRQRAYCARRGRHETFPGRPGTMVA